jgi:hypothetical protein
MHIRGVNQVSPRFTIWSIGSNRIAAGYKIFALGAFLDVERAFDNTSFEVMTKACADHEVHFTISM